MLEAELDRLLAVELLCDSAYRDGASTESQLGRLVPGCTEDRAVAFEDVQCQGRLLNVAIAAAIALGMFRHTHFK